MCSGRNHSLFQPRNYARASIPTLTSAAAQAPPAAGEHAAGADSDERAQGGGGRVSASLPPSVPRPSADEVVLRVHLMHRTRPTKVVEFDVLASQVNPAPNSLTDKTG